MTRSSKTSSNLLPGSEPFEFLHADAKIAILLVHGFTSTAYSMRELGARFHEAGCSVQGLLLPGHGTTPEELALCRWQEWYRAVENAYLRLRRTYRRVILCGQSLGGSLALYLASFHPVDAVIALSAGLSLGYGRRFFLPVVPSFVRFVPKRTGPDIREPEAKAKEVHYDRMPVQAIRELTRFLGCLRSRLPWVASPVLLMHARHDHTIGHRNMDKIRLLLGAAEVRAMTLERSYHVITLDVERSIVHSACVEFMRNVAENLFEGA